MSAESQNKSVRPVHEYEFLIKRSFLIGVIVFYIYRWYSQIMPHQLDGFSMTKILYYPELHLYKFLELDNILIEHPVISIIYSVLLLLIPVILLFKPRNQIFSWAFIFINILYHTTHTASLTHSVHFWMPVILLSWIFLARKATTFDLVWEGMRYYICLIYTSAFLWKIINGAFFQWDFGEAVFKNNLTTYYFLYPDSLMSRIYGFFLENPSLLNLGSYLGFLVEGFFVIGFFTKKFDLLLALLLIILHHLLYLFVDTQFVEWYILILPFMTLNVWCQLNGRIPQLNAH